MSKNTSNSQNLGNRNRKNSIIDVKQHLKRLPKFVRPKKRLPLNMVVSETAYRSNLRREPMFTEDVDLSKYDKIFDEDDQCLKPEIVAALQKSVMMMNSPKETAFEKYFEEVYNSRSNLYDEYKEEEDSDDESVKNVDTFMKTEQLLKSHKSFEDCDEEDVHVELNGLKVIKVFEYKETSVFSSNFKRF